MVQAALPLYLMYMELSITKYVGRSLDINMPPLIHLEQFNMMVNTTEIVAMLMVTMLMESVSLMEEIHANTSGHLLEVYMRYIGDLNKTVLALTYTKQNLHLNHLPLLGMTTSVTLAVQTIGNSTGSTTMIHYGMELAVDQTTPAVL